MDHTHWSPVTGDDGASVDDRFLARAFGCLAEDIAVDLWASDPEATVSAMLAVCLTDGRGRLFGRNAIEGWTLKRRTQGLLAIAAATAGDLWHARLRCRDEECRELLEVDLSLDSFRSDWRGDSLSIGLSDGEALKLRRPTLADLRDWAQDGEPTPRSIAESLLIGNAPPTAQGWVDEAEAALEADDPAADLQLALTCPACGKDSVVDFPLQDFLLSDLKRRGQWLLDEVHCLANAYHWSEAEILALPLERRRSYLARIREDMAA